MGHNTVLHVIRAAKSRSEVNSTTDDELRERVIALACIHDGHVPGAPVMLAPFVTNDVLHRIHEVIVSVKREQPLRWSKQKTLAMVVANFTGRPALNEAEAEYCGNLMDRHIREYVKKLNKAARNQRRRQQRRAAQSETASRTQKRSRDGNHSEDKNDEVLELRKQLYLCAYGATPLAPAFTASDDEDGAPQRVRQREGGGGGPRAVPFRPAADLRKVVRELKAKNTQLSATPDEILQLRKKLATAARNEAVARSKHALAERKCESAYAAVEKAAASEQSVREVAAAEIAVMEAVAKDATLAAEIAASKAGKRELEAAAAIRKATKTAKTLASEKAAIAHELQVALSVSHAELSAAEAHGASADSRRAQLEDEIITLEHDRGRADAAAQRAREKLKLVEEERRHAHGRVERLQSLVVSAQVEAARALQLAQEKQESVRKLEEQLEEEEARHAAEERALRELKAKMAKRARSADKRAASADALQAELEAARKKLRQTRLELTSTRLQLNMEALEDSESAEEDAMCSSDSDDDERAKAEALDRVRQMPTWRAVRGAGHGTGAAKLEWGTRLVIYSMLAMMVPPSAIGAAIVMIVKRTAPWLNPSAPTYETVQRCRFELRFIEEALAGRRVAAAYRLRSLGFDETTKFGNASLTSNVQIEPSEGAPLQNVILRAAYCPLGGTAELAVKSIETKCVSRLRDFLRRWKAKFEEMFPDDKWTGPDPVQCSLHRLGNGGALISDTCNTARKSRELLSQLIAQQVEEAAGTEAWAAMSDAEREQSTRTHHVDCWQHLRNIFLAEMSAAQARHVETELKPELDTFSTWERMSTEFSQVLRANFKEFHHGCRYYKGQGRPFHVWLCDTHPQAFAIHLERADGGRQDLDYDAAVPLYVNRRFFVEFLDTRVFQKGHKNVLEDFIYVTFRSTQYVAMVRANALVDILISRPMRWLSGKSSQLVNWSPRSMGEVLDIVEQFFIRAQYDGSLFLNPELDLFKPIADKQPLFAEWRRYTFDEEIELSPDGSVKHLVWKRTRDELLDPQDATNVRTRAKTIEYLEVQTAAALRKMHDPKLALKAQLTSQGGDKAVDDSSQAHQDLVGVHATNDALAESVFGTFDMVLRRFPGISQEAASGVSQAVRSLMLSCGDHVSHRRGSRASKEAAEKAHDYCGYLYSLPPHEQEALVELARVTLAEMRSIDRADHAALDEYHKGRRKSNEEEELDALFTRYALALSFFERWCKRGVESVGEITRALSAYAHREQEKLNYLREQIEMRVVGLSWCEWKTPWSSSGDGDIGTVAQLLSHLKEVLTAEKALGARGELPCKERALAYNGAALADECPPPLMQRKTSKALGTPTVQADALSACRTNLSPAELVAKAQRRRKELETAGEIDWVCDRQPYNTGQGPIPDKSLVGKMLEVRWRYTHRDTGEPVYMWCEGEVIQAADGEKDKLSARCSRILPAGALRIKWPADVEFDEEESFTWTVLKPCAFNKDVHLGWRFAAAELERMETSNRLLPKGKRSSQSNDRKKPAPKERS